jgi:RecF/RecN/SMC N terminal domain
MPHHLIALFSCLCSGCDPAPFYLFDELDQALDSTYRAAVARLIQRQANDKESPTQFIVSTFRQELVAVANRCFGISHQNKVSSLHHMPKQDAQLFIANLNNDEEAVGEVTSVAQSAGTRRTRDSLFRKRQKSTLEPLTEETAHEDEMAEVVDNDD